MENTTQRLQLCDCKEDGYCSRYNKEMTGRFREICQGVNCDLGTAAVFREQWKQEARESQPISSSTATPLLLCADQSPGDMVAMTAAIYSLHRAYPGKYLTAVESYWPDVFSYNPDVHYHVLPGSIEEPFHHKEPLIIDMHYPAVHQSNDRAIHFMQGWCEHLSAALGIHVPLLTNKPLLYFLQEELTEQQKLYLDCDYWLVCSGGKRDFTNKLWGQDKYQLVVHKLVNKIKFIQVGGSKPAIPWREDTNGSQEDNHPLLYGTINMVGKTTLRELFNLVRISKGVLCGVSLLMHVAAALDKPAVVIAGGREPVAWNAYPKQQYVHTVGALPCESVQGHIGQACWRSRVVPLGDGTLHDLNTCQRPQGSTPQCMNMINSEEVANLISRSHNHS